MRPLTTLRTFETVLFAAIIITHLVATWFATRIVPSNEYGGPALAEGLLLAQVGLLVAWIILGPLPWFLRLPLALGLLAAIVWPRLHAEGSRIRGLGVNFIYAGGAEAMLRFWLLSSQLALLTASLTAVRLCGGRVEYAPQTRAKFGDSFRPKWSLKTLIIATAVGAILIKMGVVVRDYWVTNEARHLEIAGALLSVLTSATVLLSLWTMLRPTDAFYRLMCVAPICAVLAFLVGMPLAKEHSDVVLPVASLLGFEAIVLVTTLGMVRVCGFRLVRAGSVVTRQIGKSETIDQQAPEPSYSSNLQGIL